jgi:hypothetical protein
VFELGPSRKLYQAQVTGLVSLALVVLRLVSGSCSVLLAWRVVCVLLEKRGLTLTELTLTINWKLPLLFCFGRRSVTTEGQASTVGLGARFSGYCGRQWQSCCCGHRRSLRHC